MIKKPKAKKSNVAIEGGSSGSGSGGSMGSGEGGSNKKTPLSKRPVKKVPIKRPSVKKEEVAKKNRVAFEPFKKAPTKRKLPDPPRNPVRSKADSVVTGPKSKAKKKATKPKSRGGR